MSRRKPEDFPRKQCSQEGCKREVFDHFWAKIQADRDGWFFQKDGSNWCPDHVPEWVPAWRERKRMRLEYGDEDTPDWTI